MPTLKECVSRVEKMIDRQFDGEFAEAKEELQSLTERIKNDAIDDKELYESIEDLTTTLNVLAKVKKRNTMLNTLARTRLYRYLKDNHFDSPVRGVEAVIAGIQSGKYGARDSLERRMDAVVRRYYQGFMDEIGKDPELEKLFVAADKPNNPIDRELATAMWELNGENPDVSGINPKVVELAKILNKYQEMARVEANEAGAWIGKLDNYVVSQSHDANMLRRGRKNKAEGLTEKQDWVAYIKTKIDVNRTLGKENPSQADIDRFLESAYDNIVDGMSKQSSDKSLDSAPIALTGSRNIGRSMSKERVLHFKSADDWYSYNLEFGKKTLREAFMADITKSGNDIAMMQMLGPTPRANLQDVTKMLAKELHAQRENHPDIPLLEGGWSDGGRFSRLFDIVEGTANGIAPGKPGAISAAVGGAYRGVMLMSSLGGMVLSMITDPAIFAQSIKTNTGKSWFHGLGNAIGTLASSVGKTPADKKMTAQKLGIFQDAVMQGVGARFGVDRDWSSGMQRAVNTFMKLNLAAWWTDNLRMASAIMFSGEIGMMAKKSHANLSEELRLSLGRSGIGEKEWSLFSNLELEDYNGNGLVTPESFRKLSDDDISSYLKSSGKTVTKRSIKEARSALESKLRGYYVDMAEYAVLNPDAKTGRLLQKHNQRGTFQGEFWRMVTMFKSFGVAVIQKSFGQELFGRGYQYDPAVGVTKNAIRSISQNKNGEFANVLSLMTGLTILGYGSMAAKDIAKGKEPADMEDPRTYARALLQGGGLGILGDFFVGEALNNRFGHSPAAAALGPAGGSFEDAMALYQGVIDLVTTGSTDKIAKESWDLILHHTPYQNHFFLRPIADYAILHTVQEGLNPGYLRRMEGYTLKQTGQEYFAPPSQGGVVGAILDR